MPWAGGVAQVKVVEPGDELGRFPVACGATTLTVPARFLTTRERAKIPTVPAASWLSTGAQ